MGIISMIYIIRMGLKGVVMDKGGKKGPYIQIKSSHA